LILKGPRGGSSLANEEPTPRPDGRFETPESYRRAARVVLLSAAAPDLHAYFLIQLRRREKAIWRLFLGQIQITRKIWPDWKTTILRINSAAMGSMKPGLFRRWTTSFLLRAVNTRLRHIYDRGHLSRVPTIHFARWVFLNDKKRLFFASNYDGSLDSYMDDFYQQSRVGFESGLQQRRRLPAHQLACIWGFKG